LFYSLMRFTPVVALVARRHGCKCNIWSQLWLVENQLQCNHLWRIPKVFLKRQHLERRFQNNYRRTRPKVDFNPSWYQRKYETHHKVQIKDEVDYRRGELSQRYITNQPFSHKAIDLMDEAGRFLKTW
jgi:hypothetical protein